MAKVSLTIVGIVIMVSVLIISASGYMLNPAAPPQNASQNKSSISSLQLRIQTILAQEACQGTRLVPPRPMGNLTPVLTMKPNTTGIICVTYTTSWNGDAASYTNDTASAASRYMFGIWIANVDSGTSHSFKITMEPSSVVPSANMSMITVLYHVTALANSTGLYAYSAPYGYCGTMPMAVGYNASQLNGSDFPPRPPPHSCPAEPYFPAAVGISGIGVAYVDIPPSRSYMTAPTSASSCTETISSYSGSVPCFSYNRSDAYTFNCAAAAATSAGCTVAFGSGASNFNVTVWYPAKNQTLSWANCYYVVKNDSGKTPPAWDICVDANSDSFVIATPYDPLT